MKTEVLEHLKNTIQPIQLEKFLWRMQQLGYKTTETRWEILQLIAEGKVAFGSNTFIWTTEADNEGTNHGGADELG